MNYRSNLRAVVRDNVNVAKHIDDARYKLRELMDRWNNRLTLQNLSVIKKYIEGRFVVICHFQVRDIHYYVECRALRDGQVALVSSNPRPSGSMGELNERNHWNNQFMLVHNVEVMQGTESIVPSIIRLYLVDDQIKDRRAMSLYFSLFLRSYKLIHAFSERESQVVRRTAASQSNSLTYREIKSGTQIVENIADYERNHIGDGAAVLKREQADSRTRTILDFHDVRISLKEGIRNSAKLLDVLIGPFDL